MRLSWGVGDSYVPRTKCSILYFRSEDVVGIPGTSLSQPRRCVNLKQRKSVVIQMNSFCLMVNFEYYSIIIDRFHIALFSAREQTHCARM